MQKDECLDKFRLLFVKLDKIDRAIRGGDDSPGVMMRLDRLERPERARGRFWRSLTTAVISSVVAAAVAAIVFWLKG